MPGDLCTAPRIISLSSLSLTTDVTVATLGASGLWLGIRTRSWWHRHTSLKLFLPAVPMGFVLSSHLLINLSRSLFHVDLLIIFWKHTCFFSVLTKCLAYTCLQDLITQTILSERYELWCSSLWSLLNFPFSSHIRPNIRLQDPVLKQPNPNTCFNVQNSVSKSYSSSYIIVLYILIFKFLDRSQEGKVFELNNIISFLI